MQWTVHVLGSTAPIQADAQVFGPVGLFMQSTRVCVRPSVNVFAARHFLGSNVPMNAGKHLSTWVSCETKQRFANAAARQSLSESALLKRLVDHMLASAPTEHLADPVAPTNVRDARLTVRLVPEDRALLRERAAARTMHAATYVSVLVRSHLRRVAPLPDRELSSLQASVRELAAIGRNLNTMARLLQQDARQAAPGLHEVQAILRVCEALRDHFRALIKANLISWDIGHADQSH